MLRTATTKLEQDEPVKQYLLEAYSGEPVNEYSLEKNSSRTTRRSVRQRIHNARAIFAEIFLPQGYPQTVSNDYLAYQRWDTLQAFASSQNGALATLAVLKGVGVGNEQATVLAATLTWLLKDGVGMIARIAFAWARGSQLDSDNKRWRLVADFLNDASFMLELTAPNLPHYFFAPIACFASFLRAIVDVCGRTTRMAVIRHQARRDNLADVAAKDGSQETLVNVFSLLCSLLLLPRVEGGHPLLAWLLFLLLTLVHLFANYRATRALHFDTLNRARLRCAVGHFLANGHTAPSIERCNGEEPILSGFIGIGTAGRRGKCHFGCPLAVLPTQDLAQLMAKEEGHLGEGVTWKWMGGKAGGRGKAMEGGKAVESGKAEDEAVEGEKALEEGKAEGKAVDEAEGRGKAEGKAVEGKAVNDEAKVLCLIAQECRGTVNCWMAVERDASEEQMFDALFGIEHFVQAGSWPSDDVVRRFRREMTAKGWSLVTNQLNIDEWRFARTSYEHGDGEDGEKKCQ